MIKREWKSLLKNTDCCPDRHNCDPFYLCRPVSEIHVGPVRKPG